MHTAVTQVLQLLPMNEHVCDGVHAQKTGSVHGRHDILSSLRRSVQVFARTTQQLRFFRSNFAPQKQGS